MNKDTKRFVAIFLLVTVPIAADAERFSLNCALTGNQGVLTFVIDTQRSTADHGPALIDQQKIEWSDSKLAYSIDRRTGYLTSFRNSNKSVTSRAVCTKSVEYKPGSNPMGDLANQSANEFVATLKQCDRFGGNTPERLLCLDEVARQWLNGRGRVYENIPESYITGNSLAQYFIEKYKKYRQ
ncbi:MAG: hypothetical protein Q7J75_02040 [Rhodoferax sp.]|nr:hypothetical protein [Rhodoferax sp.]